MNKTPKTRTAPPGAAARRRRSRGGSVLILVVALLVLMALIGTAWISTARVDRAAAVQNTSTTQIDLLVDGVINIIVGRVVDDVVDPAGGVRRGNGYVHSDNVVTDKMLAGRIPQFLDEIAPVWNPAPGIYADPPIYEAGRIVRVGADTGDFYLCVQTHRGSASETPGSSAYWVDLGNYDLNADDPADNPVFWAGISSVLPPDTKFEDIRSQYTFTRRTGMRVTTVPLNGKAHPALGFYDPLAGEWKTVPAADTDGDGTADAAYFKLPVGRLNGLDYYAAVRVVDNNAAANVSTAFGNVDVGGLALFPSSLNIGNLIVGRNANEVAEQGFNLNQARFDRDTRNDVGSGRDVDTSSVDDEPAPGETQRPDFNYFSAEQMFWMAFGRRVGNPGYWSNGGAPMRFKPIPASDAAALAYRGGTLINPEMYLTGLPAGSPFAAPSLIEQVLAPTLYFSADNHPELWPIADRTDFRRKSDPDPSLWPELFARNYDYFGRWAPTYAAFDANDRSTYRNLRALMTVANGVSTAVPSRLTATPRTAADPNPKLPGPWQAGLGYQVGDYVIHNDVVFVCVSPVPAGAGVPPGTVPNGTPPAELPGTVRSWEARPFAEFPTKASANAGTFGELFLAFWQTMAEPTSVPDALGGALVAPKYQAPLKDALRATVALDAPLDFYSPYWGGRFIAPAPGAATPTFLPYVSPGATPPAPDQNPLRMFRSPVRAAPRLNLADGFDAITPRMKPEAVMQLRAALAAVNAIDMRDNDDVVTVREVNIPVTIDLGSDALFETDDVSVLGRTRLYGHEKQPFITEVFAHTDTTTPSGMPGQNLYGYVAVEIYNPYNFPIDLANCKIGTIDRRDPGPQGRNLSVADPVRNPTLAPNLSFALSNLATRANPVIPATVVPPMGYLVLENYNAAAPGQPGQPPAPSEQPGAWYRPRSTGIIQSGAQSGPIPDPAAPQGNEVLRNFAYVPNLHTVIDKEMVLLRPLGATYVEIDLPGQNNVEALQYSEPPDATAVAWAVDMAPLDSFDFTGMRNPDPAVGSRASPLAQAWHYARPTGTGKEWRFVYPGRYDAHQSMAGAFRPRQQGTREAAAAGATAPGWDANAGIVDPWDAGPANPGSTLVPAPGPSLGTPANALAPASYTPYEYAIQLTNVAQVRDGAAGPNPVRATTGNVYPFGGYARNGDILQVPYMGSYRIKLTRFNAPPRAGLAGGVAAQMHTNPNNALYHQVLELNSITSDCTFAEDTNPYNYPENALAALGPHPREQIGRFTPSILDLEVAAAGTVETASGGGGGFTATVVTDPFRTETPTWAGYEMVITDGAGAGQVRPITAYSARRMTVFPDWDTPLDTTSRYVIRRGSRWRQVVTGTLRPTANKYWASDLFDYIAVDTPQNDHFPPADPASYASLTGMIPPHGVANTDPNEAPAVTYAKQVGGGGGGSIRGTVNLNDAAGGKYGWIEYVTGPAAGELRQVVASGGNRVDIASAFTNTPVAGDVFRVFAKKSEDLTPTQGLVNINTAPWQVLSLLPFANPDDFATGSQAQRQQAAMAKNVELAMAIARHRDGDPSAGIAPQGAFRSFFDLYRVPQFALHQSVVLARGDVNGRRGDWTPDGAGDRVTLDFEEQYLLLNRISNMITTRSDSFTVYVLVQGWRDGGTPNPELVVQRRRAFTLDRSSVTEKEKTPPIQFLYND